uniref:Exocyst complex component Sec3 PIP2-binding N-terminal domain-containing protein n=1 Tax=Kalmanozyma brasiliensis (strain GHG001) TaxID=1365824 RepID=V5EVM1_KALBG
MATQASTSQLNVNGNGAGAAGANKTKELFNAALQARHPTNAYIAHLKIWEDVAQDGAPVEASTAAGATKKARYLILAVQKDTGKVTINKAKRNANGSFSIGKDWDLNTLREVNVIQPDVFSITLSRPYQWQTQQPAEQQLFLQSLVKVYRKYTQDNGPSGGLAGGGGDARARLSSIEPIRGGAAYERMLLAGTGLTGVTEVDDDDEQAEDEDPYGGAVLTDKDAVPDTSTASKRATLGRPAVARIETQLSERSRGADEADLDEDENQTLVAVEEILEGLEWRNAGANGYGIASGKGTADVIEARLLDELSALESANIHAIIESDDRVALVVKHMEEALADLDMMDSMIAGFKVQLNSRLDDVSHIESQNRGLQVQTSNQRTLMAEIENLINTINVDDDVINTLSAGRLENADGVAQLESAAASLYKSMLQARTDGDDGGADMAAAAEKLAEYEAISSRFCKRVLEYLNITFNVETQRLLSDPARQKALQPPHPSLPDHASMEEVLGQYCGLLLYMKEVSAQTFSRVSAAYFTSVSECYRNEMQQLSVAYRRQLRKASDEDITESSFIAPSSTSAATSAIRSGTIRRGQREKTMRGVKDRTDISGQDGLQRILSCIFPVLLREQSFISDFLHINDNNITFADYMALEPYFRRRAAGMFTGASGPLREMKGAMDLIFGFVANELQAFTDDALSKDRMSIVGLLATLDRSIVEAEEVSCESLQKVLAKLQLRLASKLEQFVGEQIKGIEATKLTVKKRKGVVHFMRVFPVFVDRVEAQLINTETLPIRTAVDGYYIQICGAMFDALQTISRVETGAAGGDEDKGQLNHLVILIENMYYFISEINKGSRTRGASSSALTALVKRAETIYNDSLGSYTQFVLRRSLARLMDFSDGIGTLLRSTPAKEVSLHAAYSKSAFKKLVKDHTAKDTRKAVEALSKRVAKHFDDDEAQEQSAGEAEVLSRVWASCEQGYVREFERGMRLGQDCYPDMGVSFELGVGELRRLFAGLAPKRR